MLKTEIEHFLTYCKVSDFSGKSIETFTIRLNEFNEFLKTTTAASIKEISYQHLRRFVADFKTPSIHIKKARVWSLRQFFHFLKLNGLVCENIALDIPYPKIEKTVPHFLTIDEYNRILQYFFKKAIDFVGLRNLVIIMMLGLLGLRLGSILSLNIEDIDLETGLIWFADKGRKERTLVLPEILYKRGRWFQNNLKIFFYLRQLIRNGKTVHRRSCDAKKTCDISPGISHSLYRYLTKHPA